MVPYLDIINVVGPFVTTVGGTIRVAPEVAVSFSGGGFSRYFAQVKSMHSDGSSASHMVQQPSYQASAVDSFLTGLGDTFSGLFK